MTAAKPRPPAGLGARGRGFWRRVTGIYELGTDETELLVEACRTLDRCESLSTELAGAPSLSVGSTGQPVPHPLRAELRSERLLLTKLVSMLNLPGDAAGTVWDGLSASQRASRAARVRWDRPGRRHGSAS